MKDEFPEADMDKVITMCILHDMGEAFTGDIPSFNKTHDDEDREALLLNQWVTSLPQPYNRELQELFEEMDQKQTLEARIFKAIDNMEAVIQHNESDTKTWLPMEFELNLIYGEENAAFSNYTKQLRQQLRLETEEKISNEKGLPSV